MHMTIQENARNDYLRELLTLQQDGSQAISAPTNWTTAGPLLAVPTKMDEVVEGLRIDLLQHDHQNDVARWHFFIGSPGNGKSTAMGKLCKSLEEKDGCRVLDENGVPLPELDPTTIPYAIYVFEGANKYATAQIVQDASVVPNPFSDEVDPATELIHTLENAWKKGVSLVVCTNRGVMDKAYRDRHANPEVNTKTWFKILKRVVDASASPEEEISTIFPFDSRKPVFSQVKVGYTPLDTYSLLNHNDTFKQLVEKATAEEHWDSCGYCRQNEWCPFKANRDWLADETPREKVLRLLLRAEVLSGQVIVFREALAILSLLLAGCPRDYEGSGPCEWVRARVEKRDFFALASRRLYMSLFASSSPYGLEANDVLREQQRSALVELRDKIPEEETVTRAALGCVLGDQVPSIDVGVKRLLGADGTIAALDPLKEALPADFYDRWDTANANIVDIGSSCITGVEKACLEAWAELEESLELAADYSVARIYWAVRRWSSNFLLHLGALAEGYTAWSRELDDFIEFLGQMSDGERSIESRKRTKKLNEKLERLLDTGLSNQDSPGIRLSGNVTLKGEWSRGTLVPRIKGDELPGSVSLVIAFKGGEKATFGAPIYVWLKRREQGRLDERCFPQSLLTGVADARVRAASKGKYALVDDEIELVIDTGGERRFTLERLDGDVDVRYD